MDERRRSQGTEQAHQEWYYRGRVCDHAQGAGCDIDRAKPAPPVPPNEHPGRAASPAYGVGAAYATSSVENTE